MAVAAAIVSVVLAVLLTASAGLKLSHREPVVQGYLRVGVPEARLNLLAAVLLAGAAGLLTGLVWAPVGIAAAAGVLAYFLLAIAAHVRATDTAHLGPPVVLATLAAACLVLTLATA
jgi:hypothetical protein